MSPFYVGCQGRSQPKGCWCVAGLRGFAGGNAARVAQLAAGAAISWVTYEEVKLRLAGV